MLDKFIKTISSQLKFLPDEFANQVSITSCSYDIERFDVQLFEELNIVLSNSISRSVLKRQAEYLAGRLAARYSLNRLGFVDFNVSTGLHRNPIWPSGVSASITHSNSAAICIASCSEQFQYVGVDLERVISLDVIRKISSSVIQSDEFKLLDAINLEYNVAFTIAFSAKESLFKALYPWVGAYFEFSAAKMEIICIETGRFKVSLTKQLSTDLLCGSEFEGFFSTHSQTVTTVILK